MSESLVPVILPLMFLIGAGVFAFGSALAFGRKRRWLEEGVAVEGEVVGFVERPRSTTETTRDEDGEPEAPRHSPIVAYHSADGRMHRLTSSAVQGHGTWTIGQKLPVRYRRSVPGDADLETMATSNVPAVAMAVLAGLCLVVAAVVFLAGR
jgi:hypothetical protein